MDFSDEKIVFFDSVEKTLSLGSAGIPLWTGLRDKPGNYSLHPFIVEASSTGPIKLNIPEANRQQIINSYALDEYSYITPPPGSSQWASKIGSRKIDAAINFIGSAKPRTILEIGAGNSWVSEQLFGIYDLTNYLIVDPSFRDNTRPSDFALEVIRDYFPSNSIRERKFDLILGFSVLEHVSNPRETLSAIRAHLADDGMCILTFPDCQRAILGGDLNIFLHEHLVYFTKSSFENMAAQTGLDVVEMKTENDMISVALKKGRQKDPFSMVDQGYLLEKFTQVFNNHFLSLIRSIKVTLDSGGRVGFHGATNGLNTFLSLSNMGDHPGIFLYDNDVAKVGKFIPAFKKPVKFARSEEYKLNDLIVVTAMSFFDDIKNDALSSMSMSKAAVIPFAMRLEY